MRLRDRCSSVQQTASTRLAVDSTAMNSMVALYERCQKNGVTLILSHVNEQPMHVMEKAGFVDMIGRAHFCPNIEAALDHADEVLGK